MEDFQRQRRSGIVAIAVGAVAALGLWFAIVRLLAPLAGMDSLAARMLFTLKCWCASVAFSLLLGTEAVAHERLVSPAFDPLAGFETRRLKVNQRYLQNTLEQTVIFAAALFGLAAYSPDGAAMRSVAAAATVWTASRLGFWLGYHRSAAWRGLGVAGMALGMVLLVYVAARFAGEIAGWPGAIAVVGLYVGAEAVLFLATSRRQPRA